LKTQLDQQKGVVDNLVSNTRVSFHHIYLYILYFDLLYTVGIFRAMIK
jgi:hypothetical protein